MAKLAASMGWKPSDFWESTFYDFCVFLDGHMASNGVEKAMSRNDFLELKWQARKMEIERGST